VTVEGAASIGERAAQTGVASLFVGAYALLAWCCRLPEIPAATALAVSIGLGGGVVSQLQQRRALCVAWADLTAAIAAAFWAAQLWNAYCRSVDLGAGLDLAIGLGFVFAGVAIARAAHRLDAG
jgi:hypothetical protein